jgi:hypothetical protein
MPVPLLLAFLLTGCSDQGDGSPVDTAGDTGGDTDTDDTPVITDPDRDGDGFGESVDCDDTRAGVNPGVTADICNDRDDDCDGDVDEDPDLAWYLDADQDGFGLAGGNSFVTCDPGSASYATNDADCDDDSAQAFPGADEICDGVDDDCNGEVDENEALWSAFYLDDDGDGAGVPDTLVYGCDAASVGGADNALDCDDRDPYEPVFADVSGARSGTGTVDDPMPSIQSAILAARTCVVVAPGTYYEDLDFRGRDITVSSSAGATDTVVYGTGYAPVVTFANGESTDAVLDGFTLTGGGGALEESNYTSDGVTYYSSYARGGGVYVYYSGATLRNLLITDNALADSYGYYSGSSSYYYGGSYGGGLYADDADVVLTDVDFVANNASEGAAIYQFDVGTLTATRVGIYDHTGEFGTLALYYGTSDWSNLVINNNASSQQYGGIYSVYGTVTVDNATLIGNDYGVYNYGSAVTLHDSIVSANVIGLYDNYVGYSTWDLAYNDVIGNVRSNYYSVTDPTGSNGNIQVAPAFNGYTDDGDGVSDDLTLSSRSGCINAGDPAAVENDVDGTRNDIGAFGGPGGSW